MCIVLRAKEALLDPDISRGDLTLQVHAVMLFNKTEYELGNRNPLPGVGGIETHCSDAITTDTQSFKRKHEKPPPFSMISA